MQRASNIHKKPSGINSQIGSLALATGPQTRHRGLHVPIAHFANVPTDVQSVPSVDRDGLSVGMANWDGRACNAGL